MTSIRLLWLTLCLLWIFSEIKLSLNSGRDEPNWMQREENSQTRIRFSIVISLGFALWFKQRAWLPIPIDYLPRQLVALLLFAAGLTIRYQAIRQLGSFFSTDVTIHRQHRLITEGLYRRIRHPTYTGLLLALTAAGLAMGDVLSMLSLTAANFWSIKTRIDIEEKMLLRAFGTDYLDYCNRSWNLLPWIF
ncbi:methyltransferase family protein [Methylomonas sp. MgM2]